MTLRKVFLEPVWNLHAFQRQMLTYPPSGYQFISVEKPREKAFNTAAHWGSARALLRASDAVIPIALAKAWLERWKPRPPGTLLTYAVDHLVFRPEPWVVEVEYAAGLVGIHPKHFRRFRRVAERALASTYCRRILCWSGAGRRSLSDLGWARFEHKIEVVYSAVPPKRFVKQHRRGQIKLLFVGSGSSKGAFEGRGSEIFEVFASLRERYRNLELVVRSDIPSYLRHLYSGMANVKVIDKVVPREVLEQEFQTADIFLFPSYHTLPATILEAMSYELPVVAVDAWANAEYVEDGRTGLITPRPGQVLGYCADTLQPNFLAPSFLKAFRVPNRETVAALAAAVGTLIEKPELRQRFGKAARWEVEQGKFSLARMNEKLTQIFDEAIGEEYDPAGGRRVGMAREPAKP